MESRVVDQHLIQQARIHDESAWAELVERYWPLVLTIARRQIGNWDDAQDIAQEAFWQSYQRLESLRDDDRFTAWLRQITLNLCRGWHRQRKFSWITLDAFGEAGVIAQEQTLGQPLPDVLIGQATSAESQLAAHEMIEQAIARLPNRLQTIARLYHWQELKYQEIAARLHLPLGTVKRRLHEARQQLKQEIIAMQPPTILKHAVGLETMGDRHTPLFIKGTHLPAACTLDFSTAQDGQTEITLRMLQGDSTEASACRRVVDLRLSGIAPNQKSQTPRLKVTLTVDVNGMLQCQARELPNSSLTIDGEPASIETESAIV